MEYPFILKQEVLELLTKTDKIDKNAYLTHSLSFDKPMFYEVNKSLYLFSEASNVEHKKTMNLSKVENRLDSFLTDYIDKYNYKVETYSLANATMVFVLFNDNLAYLYSTSSVDPTINANILISFFSKHKNIEVLTNYLNNEVINLPSELIPLYFENYTKLDLSNPEFDFFTLEGIKYGWFSKLTKEGKAYCMFDGTTYFHTMSSNIVPSNDDNIYSSSLGMVTLMRCTPIYKEVETLIIKEVDYYTFVNFYMENIKIDKEEDISLALSGVKYTGGRFFIAYLKDKKVGSFVLEKKGKNFVYLSYVALVKEERGHSLGKGLIQLAFNEISKDKLDCVIGVVDTNLFHFYHSLGFKDVGYWKSK